MPGRDLAIEFGLKGYTGGYGGTGSGGSARDELGLNPHSTFGFPAISDTQAPSTPPRNFSDYMSEPSSRPSATSYADTSLQGEYSAGGNAVTGGYGANGNYVGKAEDFVSNNSIASPDYHRNWVNDGQWNEFANRHGSEITNEWARMGDRFNNQRWWNPGTAGELGQFGAHNTGGSIGEVGRGERREPIGTQELRAQQRREGWEDAVQKAGINRQDIYKLYPYDMSKMQQGRQMQSNYAVDDKYALLRLSYGDTIRKANAASKATGVYSSALWAMLGIGGYHYNDWDREMVVEMDSIVNNNRLSREEKEQQMVNLTRRYAEVKAQELGTTVTEVLQQVVKQFNTNDTSIIKLLQSAVFGGMLGSNGTYRSGIFD